VLEVKAQGLAKSVGVSNFGWKHLQQLKATGLEVPDLNQIELHIFNQQKETVEYCLKEGIVVEGHCPLARNKNFGQTRLTEIAKSVNKSEAEVALRWSYQSGFVTIPKSQTPQRIRDNFSIAQWELSDEVMKECLTLDQKFQASKVVTHMDLDWEEIK